MLKINRNTILHPASGTIPISRSNRRQVLSESASISAGLKGPEEAVQIGLDLKAKTLIAMHWGTIDLSDEPYWEPPERFRKKAGSSGYSGERIWVIKIGETRVIPHAARP